MQFFAALTTNMPRRKEDDGKQQHEREENVVIMGRKTWDSIPEKFKPLKGRRNIVLTRNPDRSKFPESVSLFSSLSESLEFAYSITPYDGQVFVIGGASLYKESLSRNDCEFVFLTSVECPLDIETTCDVHMPSIPTDFRRQSVQEFMSIVGNEISKPLPKDLICRDDSYPFEFQLLRRIPIQ
ncbi:dihydrofolate reductase [Blyttiomyces sp. JEL0837]|nr:dihydrofolate reductase [Blyttiomyces sp. JEL0837]